MGLPSTYSTSQSQPIIATVNIITPAKKWTSYRDLKVADFKRSFKKFDIVLVDFPFSNLTKTKKRPALVINPLEGENAILCQITTKRRNIEKYEIFMKKESCLDDIRFDSYIYVDMIFTLHKNLKLRLKSATFKSR